MKTLMLATMLTARSIGLESVPTITNRFLQFVYPANINPADYDWYLQESIDLVHWTTTQTNTGNDFWVDSRTNPYAFYRLSSQP